MKIEWAAPAQAALDEYLGYLHEQRPPSAARAMVEIRTAAGMLARFPEMGRPSRWPGLRERRLTRWRKIMVYRVSTDTVTIVAFYDARQDLTAVDPLERE